MRFHPLHREQGFTLIELMLVLAIIAIVATMAISQINGVQPRYRMVADSIELRGELAATRGRALRDHKLNKICIFMDPTPTDATAYGVYTELECNDNGAAGCSAAPFACDSTKNASNWAYLSGKVDTSACATAGKWCQKKVVNLNSDLSKAAEHISFDSLRDSTSARAQITASVVEITFQPNGLIQKDYSSASGGTSGFVRITTFDQCLPSIASCTGFKTKIDVGWTFGGSFRVLE